MSSFGFVFLEILVVVVAILSWFVMTMNTLETLTSEKIIVVKFLLSELSWKLGVEITYSGIIQ